MTDHEFDRAYWDRHWQGADGDAAARRELPPNPHLVREVEELAPGTALEAGCGEGAEAIWLALAGWRVTAADIAEEPLARAARRAAEHGVAADAVDWVRADLSTWEPATTYDLVTTHYAHPAMPQLEFYDRLATWVAPGGTLLVVGHLHHGEPPSEGHGHGGHHGQPPAEASATAVGITERLDPDDWEVVTATEQTRTVDAPSGGGATLRDVVVRAVRRGPA